MLDMELRARTDNTVSLDTVLKNLYEHHPLDAGGFTTGDMLDTLEDLSGSSFVAFFDDYVSGTAPLDLESALKTVGLTLEAQPADEGSYLGISVSENKVRSVRTDGPAFDAGVEVDDLVIALNDTKIEETPLDEILDTIAPCSEITLSITRRGQPRKIHMTTIAKPIDHWTLTRLSDPTPSQQAAYATWLGQDWPTTIHPELPDLSQPTPSDP